MVRYTANLRLRVTVEFDRDPGSEEALLAEVVDRLSVEYDNTHGRLLDTEFRRVRIKGDDGSRVKAE